MIFTVEISEQADSDLRAIYEYIAFELLSPDSLTGWKRASSVWKKYPHEAIMPTT